jgi:hypothetical protein
MVYCDGIERNSCRRRQVLRGPIMSMRENIAARFRAFMTDYDDDCGIPEAEAEAVLDLLSPAQCHADELAEALSDLCIAARRSRDLISNKVSDLDVITFTATKGQLKAAIRALAKLEKEEGK